MAGGSLKNRWEVGHGHTKKWEIETSATHPSLVTSGYRHSNFITSILSTFLEQPITFMPLLSSARAIAAPIPDDAPVTNAIRPAQRSIVNKLVYG